MVTGLAIDNDEKIVKFVYDDKSFEFTYEEFEELTTLYSEMINTSYFGDVLCVYRDKENKIHRLCK